MKLDLGSGYNRKAGFTSVDSREACKPDQVLDLKGPWPWEPNSVDEVYCHMYLQYLTGPERIEFMNRLWYVLKPGSQATIIVPYGQSSMALWDPLTQWPPLIEGSFLYFNAKWRETNKVLHPNINCDFDFGYGYVLQNGWNLRAEEARNHALIHNWNVAAMLQVTLTRRG